MPDVGKSTMNNPAGKIEARSSVCQVSYLGDTGTGVHTQCFPHINFSWMVLRLQLYFAFVVPLISVLFQAERELLSASKADLHSSCLAPHWQRASDMGAGDWLVLESGDI